MNKLTKHEIKILNLVKEGYINSEIAAELGILTPTVKCELVLIYAKLQATNRTDAVVKAFRQKYIKLSS